MNEIGMTQTGFKLHPWRDQTMTILSRISNIFLASRRPPRHALGVTVLVAMAGLLLSPSPGEAQQPDTLFRERGCG
jgi:hypothetical protein